MFSAWSASHRATGRSELPLTAQSRGGGGHGRRRAQRGVRSKTTIVGTWSFSAASSNTVLLGPLGVAAKAEPLQAMGFQGMGVNAAVARAAPEEHDVGRQFCFPPFQCFLVDVSPILLYKVDSTWGLTKGKESQGPHGQEKTSKTHHSMDKFLQCWLKIGSI